MLDFSQAPPKSRPSAQFTGNVSVPNNGNVTIPFSGENWKDDGYIHNNTTNNTRIGVVHSGVYKLTFKRYLTASTGSTLSSFAQVFYFRNGVFVDEISVLNIDSTNFFSHYFTAVVVLSGGDYIEFNQYQNNLGTRTWFFDLTIERLG